MEAWRDELYHYGVKGMKWKHKKGSESGVANELRKQAYIQGAYSANEVATGRDYDRKSVNYAKQYYRKANRLRNTANAVESGKRPAPRPKHHWSTDVGEGLYRRGSGLGKGKSAAGSSKSRKGLTSSGRYSGARSKRKERAAKYVKRVLA